MGRKCLGYYAEHIHGRLTDVIFYLTIPLLIHPGSIHSGSFFHGSIHDASFFHGSINPGRAKRYPHFLLMIPWFTVLKFTPATSHPPPPTPKRVTLVRFNTGKLIGVRYVAGFTTLDVAAFTEGLLAIK